MSENFYFKYTSGQSKSDDDSDERNSFNALPPQFRPRGRPGTFNKSNHTKINNDQQRISARKCISASNSVHFSEGAEKKFYSFAKGKYDADREEENRCKAEERQKKPKFHQRMSTKSVDDGYSSTLNNDKAVTRNFHNTHRKDFKAEIDKPKNKRPPVNGRSVSDNKVVNRSRMKPEFHSKYNNRRDFENLASNENYSETTTVTTQIGEESVLVHVEKKKCRQNSFESKQVTSQSRKTKQKIVWETQMRFTDRETNNRQIDLRNKNQKGNISHIKKYQNDFKKPSCDNFSHVEQSTKAVTKKMFPKDSGDIVKLENNASYTESLIRENDHSSNGKFTEIDNILETFNLNCLDIGHENIKKETVPRVFLLNNISKDSKKSDNNDFKLNDFSLSAHSDKAKESSMCRANTEKLKLSSDSHNIRRTEFSEPKGRIGKEKIHTFVKELALNDAISKNLTELEESCRPFSQEVGRKDTERNKIVFFIDLAGETSDAIVSCDSVLHIFLSLYEEWRSKRSKSLSLLEKLVNNIDDKSCRYEGIADAANFIGKGASAMSFIPHPYIGIASRVIAPLCSFIAALFKSSPSFKKSGLEEVTLMLALEEDIRVTDVMYIHGLQCEQQFQDTMKIIEEFHYSAQEKSLILISDNDIEREFLNDILKLNPQNNLIYYKRLQKWLERMSKNESTSELMGAFARGFKDWPRAMSVLDRLTWRFHPPDLDKATEVFSSWVEINEQMEKNGSIPMEIVKEKIRNAIITMKREFSEMEECLRNLTTKEL